MTVELKENGGLPARILWTLAIVAGVSVANIYYNQPRLNVIGRDLGVSEFSSNLIAMITQVGYAVGLLFIVPLGDLCRRKNIVLVNFSVLVFSLLAIACSTSIYVIWAASFLTGVGSMIPQIFVPIASQFSRPEHKGRNVGIVISGLLTGILASRVGSGVVGDVLGWRAMYFIASGLMLVCAFVVMKVLPDIRPTFKGSYAKLMASLFSLLRDYPALRVYSVRAGLAFGSFLSLWACLSFKMAQAPFYADSDVVGFLGFGRQARQDRRRAPLQLHWLCAYAACMGISPVSRRHLCWSDSRRDNHRHRHAVHTAQQSGKHVRGMPRSIKQSEHHIHDNILCRRFSRHIPCRHGLACRLLDRCGGRRRMPHAGLTCRNAVNQAMSYGAGECCLKCKRPQVIL